MLLFVLLLLLVSILFEVRTANDGSWELLFHLTPLCSAEKYFEITLTTYHTEPITSLESFNFKSKVNAQRDKTQLDIDIQAACAKYSIVNCDDISRVIYEKYDQFIQTLDREKNQSCPTIPTIDDGYYEHVRSGKSLTPATDPSKVQFPGRPRTASEALTVVSGYWNTDNKYAKIGEQNLNPYEEWMKKTLRLYMPYVFFTESRNVLMIKNCRHGLPTLIAEHRLSNFKTHDTYDPTWIHSEHVPSPVLATIWLEKLNLMLLASQMTNTTFYAWVDAGLGTFRYSELPQEEWSLDVVMSLPTTRLSYSHAHGTYHSFAATVMIMHRDLIPIIHDLFYKEYDSCREHIHDWRCGSEQFLLTAVRDKFPHLFHAMSHEYGDISFLWANRYPFQKAKAKL